MWMDTRQINEARIERTRPSSPRQLAPAGRADPSRSSRPEMACVTGEAGPSCPNLGDTGGGRCQTSRQIEIKGTSFTCHWPAWQGDKQWSLADKAETVATSKKPLNPDSLSPTEKWENCLSSVLSHLMSWYNTDAGHPWRWWNVLS